jgi:flavin reductase (DIM6/NTAB) family NADH-FMN oxidoreductase RutF
MRDVNAASVYAQVMAQVQAGAFLTVRAGERLNTMTIGWATFGIAWRREVMMVMVRDSRHTYTLIEKAADFTVSVPAGGMKRELAFCGTKSGRAVDKFAECGLETLAGRQTASPIVRVPGIHFECRIVYKSPIDPAHLDPGLAPLYPDKDYHTLYFGEILGCYEIE